jgi:hypothetical protein
LLQKMLEFQAPPVIYAIYAIRGLKALSGNENPFKLDNICLYRPPHISPRIPAQQAVFTVHNKPDFDVFAPENVPAGVDVGMWTIPNKTRSSFWLKKYLNRCGINRGSLFPDLDGLALHLGWRYKWGMF